MFQIADMDPQFIRKITQRLLELQSRLQKCREDGKVSTSLLKDLSALLKWSTKIGLLSESEIKNVQHSLNIVQNYNNIECPIEMTTHPKNMLENSSFPIDTTSKRRWVMDKHPHNKLLVDYGRKNWQPITKRNHKKDSSSNVFLQENNKWFNLKSSKIKLKQHMKKIYQHQRHRIIRNNRENEMLPKKIRNYNRTSNFPAQNFNGATNSSCSKIIINGKIIFKLIKHRQKAIENNKLSRIKWNLKSMNCISTKRYVSAYEFIVARTRYRMYLIFNGPFDRGRM